MRSEPQAIAAYHPGESADGFDRWAVDCISKLDGASAVRAAEVYENYLQFCDLNDYQQRMTSQAFGGRLAYWLLETYGIKGRHSGTQGGTVYDDVVLTEFGPTIAAPAMNGILLMLFAWLKPKQPQNCEALAFIQSLALEAAQPFTILAAPGRNGMEVATFRPHSGELRPWLVKRANKRLFVLTAQATAPLAGHTISESDLVHTRIVAVTVGAAQRSALDTFRPAPLVIVETPRGFAAAWRLRNPTAPGQGA